MIRISINNTNWIQKKLLITIEIGNNTKENNNEWK